MLSIHKIAASSAGGVSRYYENLGREDYYTQGGEPPGYWLGHGAEQLGLSGTVRDGELLKLMQGYDPSTGTALARNAGAEHAPGWDATFSAPKSVSAIWAVADRDTQIAIQQAQQRAVSFAIGYLECEAAFTRFGAGGAEREPVNFHGGLIVAAYEHSTSRNADPQLHTHCIIGNVTPDGRGIDLDTRHKMAAGALFRVELAHQMRELGYAVERDGNSFRIAGVPRELTEHWSSRHAEVRQSLTEMGLDSYTASKVAVLDTREAKTDVNRAELFAQWREQAREFGFSREAADRLRIGARDHLSERPAPEQILAAATEQHSTVSRVQLLHRVAVDLQGMTSAADAEKYLQSVTAHPEAVRLIADNGTERWTTRSMLDLERNMIHRAQDLSLDGHHRVTDSAVHAAALSRTLSDEQLRAVKHIVCDSGAMACVQGHAGTGKSYMLDAAREAWQSAGYSVHGAALSGKAAEGLQNSAGIQSQTIHSLLREIDDGRATLDAKTIFVVDEAGMIGSRQMARLIDHAKDANAKLVLVGDTKQLQSIDAGAAFRAIQERIGFAELIDARRQRYEADREVARAFREGRAGDSLANLDQRGLLHVADDARKAQLAAVDNFMRDVTDGKRTVLLAATRSETRALNELAHERFRDAGLLQGQDMPVVTSRGERQIAAGDQVVFLRNSEALEVKNGTAGVVQSIDQNAMRVQLADGSLRVVEHDRGYNHIDYGYALTVHKAQGATVDRAHIVANEITGREWTYVAATRSREETRIYTTSDARVGESSREIATSELTRDMARSHEKDSTNDYTPHRTTEAVLSR
jgi:Ti-type conjugative transfer relaxase TraA